MYARGTQCARLEHKRVHKDHFHAFFSVYLRVLSFARVCVCAKVGVEFQRPFVLLALCSPCFFHSDLKHHRPLVKSSRNTTPD